MQDVDTGEMTLAPFTLVDGREVGVASTSGCRSTKSSNSSHKQIRLTVIHELGHYFGMDEEQLKDV
jgi:hypothetical protein